MSPLRPSSFALLPQALLSRSLLRWYGAALFMTLQLPLYPQITNRISTQLANNGALADSLISQLNAIKQERLELLQRHDTTHLIARMREIFSTLTKLKEKHDIATQQKIISLERELAVITQQYLKGLTPATLEQLRKLALSIRKVKRAVRSLAPDKLPYSYTDIFDTLFI